MQIKLVLDNDHVKPKNFATDGKWYNVIVRNYRCRMLIRYPKDLFIQKYLSQSLNKIKNIPGIKLEVDVDPINFS